MLNSLFIQLPQCKYQLKKNSPTAVFVNHQTCIAAYDITQNYTHCKGRTLNYPHIFPDSAVFANVFPAPVDRPNFQVNYIV